MSIYEITKAATKFVDCEGKQVFLAAEMNNNTDDQSFDICISLDHDSGLECIKHDSTGEIIERLEGADVMKHLKFVCSDESSNTAFYNFV